jgi:hypothetical protein
VSGRGLLALTLALGFEPLAWAQDPAPPVAVAKLSFAEGQIERASGDGTWQPVAEGAPVRTGERLRTGPEALATLEFPWMRIRMSASTELSIPSGLVLSMVLARGRIEILSEGDIIKLISQGAEVRGQGRGVVRQVGGTTTVAAMEGRFRVTARDRRVSLTTGQGTVVASGQPPASAAPLPQAPETVDPGSDPFYVEPGRDLRLSWSPSQSANHIQVLPIDSDQVLIDRDVGASPQSVRIPWLGTFRWRVSVSDDRGLEGLPSAEGLICVVDE